MDIKSTVGHVTSNPIGAVAGGLAGYFGASKIGITNTYAHWGLVVVGIFAGAFVQGKISAHASAPKAATVAGK